MTEESKKLIIRILDIRIAEIKEAIILMHESVTKHEYMEFLHDLNTARNEMLK